MGSSEHPLSSLSIQGSVNADGENSDPATRREKVAFFDNFTGGPGGGSGGTILLFLHTLAVGETAILSSMGGYSSSSGGGGGGGGRIHFHWSNIPTGDVYQPIASVKGDIHTGYVYKKLLFKLYYLFKSEFACYLRLQVSMKEGLCCCILKFL